MNLVITKNTNSYSLYQSYCFGMINIVLSERETLSEIVHGELNQEKFLGNMWLEKKI